MRREHRVERAMRMRPVTRPAVIGGLLDHAGGHRVHLDMAQAGEQIVVLLNQTGTETAFPETTAAPVSPVDVLHMALTERLHDAARRARIVGTHEQMDRVGHQYTGVHATALPARMISQPVEVVLAVVRCEKAGLAVVSALNPMQWYAGK